MTENPKQDDPNSQAVTDEEAKAAAAANFHNMLDQSNHSIESRPSEFLGGDPSLASPTRRKKLVLSPLRSPGTLTPGGDRTLRPEGWLGSPSRRSYVVKKTIPNPLDLDLDDDEDGGGDEEVESPDTTKKQTSTAEVQVPTSNNPQSSSALKTYQETRRSYQEEAPSDFLGTPKTPVRKWKPPASSKAPTTPSSNRPSGFLTGGERSPESATRRSWTPKSSSKPKDKVEVSNKTPLQRVHLRKSEPAIKVQTSDHPSEVEQAKANLRANTRSDDMKDITTDEDVVLQTPVSSSKPSRDKFGNRHKFVAAFAAFEDNGGNRPEAFQNTPKAALKRPSRKSNVGGDTISSPRAISASARTYKAPIPKRTSELNNLSSIISNLRKVGTPTEKKSKPDGSQEDSSAQQASELLSILRNLRKVQTNTPRAGHAHTSDNNEILDIIANLRKAGTLKRSSLTTDEESTLRDIIGRLRKVQAVAKPDGAASALSSILDDLEGLVEAKEEPIDVLNDCIERLDNVSAQLEGDHVHQEACQASSAAMKHILDALVQREEAELAAVIRNLKSVSPHPEAALRRENQNVDSLAETLADLKVASNPKSQDDKDFLSSIIPRLRKLRLTKPEANSVAEISRYLKNLSPGDQDAEAESDLEIEKVKQVLDSKRKVSEVASVLRTLRRVNRTEREVDDLANEISKLGKGFLGKEEGDIIANAIRRLRKIQMTKPEAENLANVIRKLKRIGLQEKYEEAASDEQISKVKDFFFNHRKAIEAASVLKMLRRIEMDNDEANDLADVVAGLGHGSKRFEDELKDAIQRLKKTKLNVWEAKETARIMVALRKTNWMKEEPEKEPQEITQLRPYMPRYKVEVIAAVLPVLRKLSDDEAAEFTSEIAQSGRDDAEEVDTDEPKQESNPPAPLGTAKTVPSDSIEYHADPPSSAVASLSESGKDESPKAEEKKTPLVSFEYEKGKKPEMILRFPAVTSALSEDELSLPEVHDGVIDDYSSSSSEEGPNLMDKVWAELHEGLPEDQIPERQKHYYFHQTLPKNDEEPEPDPEEPEPEPEESPRKVVYAARHQWKNKKFRNSILGDRRYQKVQRKGADEFHYTPLSKDQHERRSTVGAALLKHMGDFESMDDMVLDEMADRKMRSSKLVAEVEEEEEEEEEGGGDEPTQDDKP